MKPAARYRWANLLRGVATWRRGLTDLVFPPSCVSCGIEVEGAEAGELLLCPLCFDEIEQFEEPMCQQCGAPIPAVKLAEGEAARPVSIAADCYRCRGRKLWFGSAVALGPYSGQLRALLLRMKSAEGDALSLQLGRLLWHLRREQLMKLSVDVIVPIPLHWRRRMLHRTNSAALLAEVLAAKLRVPHAEGLLRRTRSTLRQFDLTPPQRWANVRNAFAVRAGHHLRNAHVLVMDDILTTGATCSEAARALRAAGARRVTVAVIARAFGE